MHRTLVPGLLVLLSALAWPSRADAQIRRCTDPAGRVIFTDRACQDMGASDGVATAAPSTLGGKPYARGCSRNVQTLMEEVSASIGTRDVNRLSGVYNWAGASSSGSYSVLGRLEAIANRPLIGISPVLAAPSLHVDEDGTTSVSGNVDASAYAGASVRRTPVGLRVDQTLANGDTPTHLVFGLRRYMGCWWVTL